MTGKTHKNAGILGSLILSCLLLFPLSLTTLVSSILGSSVPDWDIKIHKCRWLIRVIGAIIIITSIINEKSLSTYSLGFTFIVISFIKHRTLTHSIIGCVLINAIFYILFNSLGIGKYFIFFNISYLLHMLFDLMTPVGDKLGYPADKYYRIPLYIETESYNNENHEVPYDKSNEKKKGKVERQIRLAMILMIICFMCVLLIINYPITTDDIGKLKGSALENYFYQFKNAVVKLASHLLQ